MENIIKWFLNDHFWLPKDVTFAELDKQTGKLVAGPRDLLVVPLYGVALLLCRWLFEKLVANPIAEAVGVSCRQHNPPAREPQLEQFFRTCRNPPHVETEKLAKKLEVDVKYVQRWFRRRRNAERPNLRRKFSEAFWRCFFYLFAFTYGSVMLYEAPWFWDTSKCWEGYPRQGIWTSQYFYYMLEGGFYVSLLYSVMGDVKRKDFTEQLIHHAATILLIIFSYIANYHRVGTLVMAVHDVSDIVLEGAKCFKYAKKEKVADLMFVIFAVVFIISRLMVYPYMILYTTVVESLDFLGYFPSYYLFNLLLLILQGLHIFWASIIVRMAVRMWMVGMVEKDERSDVEEPSSQDEDQEEKNKKNM